MSVISEYFSGSRVMKRWSNGRKVHPSTVKFVADRYPRCPDLSRWFRYDRVFLKIALIGAIRKKAYLEAVANAEPKPTNRPPVTRLTQRMRRADVRNRLRCPPANAIAA